MLSPKALKKIDPELAHLSDEEIEAIRDSFYAFGQLIFEDWYKEKFGSKNPVGSLSENVKSGKI